MTLIHVSNNRDAREVVEEADTVFVWMHFTYNDPGRYMKVPKESVLEELDTWGNAMAINAWDPREKRLFIGVKR